MHTNVYIYTNVYMRARSLNTPPDWGPNFLLCFSEGRPWKSAEGGKKIPPKAEKIFRFGGAEGGKATARHRYMKTYA